MGPAPRWEGYAPVPWKGSWPAEKLDQMVEGVLKPENRRAATSLWKAKWRVTWTEGQLRHSMPPNLKYSSVSEGGGQVLSSDYEAWSQGQDQG